MTEDGKKYGNEKVRWIFEAEQRAMEDTDPVEVQAYISMLEKYMQRFREEIEERTPQSEKDNE